MTDVAALYVDSIGIYPKLPEVDSWDVNRDARFYAGPHPVVAHPPCKHWGRLRHLAKDATCLYCDGSGRWKDPQWAKGWVPCRDCNGSGRVSDRDCAPRAVEQVRAYGGVLEHPAWSLLWEACGLPAPDFDVQPGGALHGKVARISSTRNERGDFADAHGGYTIELDQCEWGHVARKRTWLYLVGVPREALEAPPFPGREPTHYIGGGRTKSSRKGGRIPEGKKATSETQRRRTPPLFAEYLVRLARAAAKELAA